MDRVADRVGEALLAFGTSGHYKPTPVDSARNISMPTSEDYRHQAEETRILAKQTTDREERDRLMLLADQWGLLAEHKAKKEAGQER